MRWWETPVGSPIRGRLIALIRRGVDTVEALAAELEVTDNAVRSQLAILEREGLVARSGVRHGAKAGKPATVYVVAQAAEAVLSAAHAPVLRALVEALKSRLPEATADHVLRDAGRRLVPETAERTDGGTRPNPEKGARAAARVLRSLGADVRVEKTADGVMLKGFACPLADVVAVDHHACHVVEELVSGVAGVPARECCERGERPRCRFLWPT